MTDHMPETALTRHAKALLDPITPGEQIVSGMFRSLSQLADIGKDDAYLIPAIEKLGSSIITVNSHSRSGRIDQSAIDKQVRDTVRRAGGDAEEL